MKKTLGRRRRRLRHNLLLLVGSLVGGLAVVGALDSDHGWFLVSMATGYVSLALLGFTLILGPWNVIRSRPNPVSTDLRRDAGIWCALWAFAHVIAGLGVHMAGKWWLYFIPEPGRWRYVPVRTDLFGFANYTGLLATLLLALLLAISSDRALARLGARRWKSLQRWNYAILLLVVVHSVAYIWIVKRSLGFVVLFCFLVGLAATLQLLGVRRIQGSTEPARHQEHERI